MRATCRKAVFGWVAAALLLAAPNTAAAQEAGNVSTSRMVSSGLALGVAGYGGGALLGNWIERGIRGRDGTACTVSCGGTGEVLLGVLGGSTGVAAGVHWANDSQGDFGREMLSSLAIGAGGALAVTALSKLLLEDTSERRPLVTTALAVVYLVAIPAAQLMTSVNIEKKR